VANLPGRYRRISTGGTPIHAVALKAVHGGPKYRGTFLVDDGVVEALRQFLPAAPAHNAIYLTAIEAFRQAMPGVPMWRLSSRSFTPLSGARRLYGVPGAWLEDGVAKYGFHGASHQYIAERVAAMLGRQVKLVSCTWGEARRCARSTADGRWTPPWVLAAVGLGELDAPRRPGRLRRALHDGAPRMECQEVRNQLASGGGLAGLSASRAAMCATWRRRGPGQPPRGDGVEVFVYEVKKSIGAFAAAMGGLEAVAFTGGIARTPPGCGATAAKGWSFSVCGWTAPGMKPEAETGWSRRRIPASPCWRLPPTKN